MAKIPDWMRELDLEETVDDTLHEFEYTKRAARSFRHLVNSEDFEDLDRESIYQFLKSRKEAIPFGSYLKRYIYLKTEMEDDFDSIDEKEYQHTIMSSFEENQAPRAFEETTRKWSATVKKWLQQDTAQRKTVFLLGFGLNMSPEDVSDFLTKVLLEADFNFRDPRETIYWHCYENHFPYRKAQDLLQMFSAMKSEPLPEYVKEENVEDMLNNRDCNIESEEGLLHYLAYLKGISGDTNSAKEAIRDFETMWEQLRDRLAEDASISDDSGKVWSPQEISGLYMEKALLYGIPRDENDNMVRMSQSSLYKQFGRKRFSRQRVSKILKDQEVDRLDLITLKFFLTSLDETFNNNMERYETFLQEMNAILQKCGMYPVYPPNPQEAFMLACLMTEEPLEVYNDVLAMSYEDGGD